MSLIVDLWLMKDGWVNESEAAWSDEEFFVSIVQGP